MPDGTIFALGGIGQRFSIFAWPIKRGRRCMRRLFKPTGRCTHARTMLLIYESLLDCDRQYPILSLHLVNPAVKDIAFATDAAVLD
jgi:hypothetical protein